MCVVFVVVFGKCLFHIYLFVFLGIKIKYLSKDYCFEFYFKIINIMYFILFLSYLIFCIVLYHILVQCVLKLNFIILFLNTCFNLFSLVNEHSCPPKNFNAISVFFFFCKIKNSKHYFSLN